ncbi:MAG: SIMPL domain-containing protein [Acidobacteriota bacterium]
MRTATFTLAGWLAAGAMLQAQELAPKPPRPYVRATGEATVSVRPDQAQIDIGVVTEAATAQAAGAQNATRLEAVLAELRKALGAGAEIKSSGYSLNPNRRYPKDGGQPVIVGYTATNVVQVKTKDLAGVGKVIDLATQSGANAIHGLYFTLKDEQAARAKALGEATLKARSQAEAMAAALGLKILRVISIEQGEPMMIRPLREMPMARMAEAMAAPTPVEPGTIDVRATVTVTAELGP